MSSVQPFIPLYFGEEDQDLWQALCLVNSEKRSAYIKGVLRKHFLGEEFVNRGQIPGLHAAELDSSDTQEEDDDQINDDQEFALDNLTFEDLFINPDPMNLESLTDFNNDSNNIEFQKQGEEEKGVPVMASSGLDYILNSVIGVEEDKGVINAILARQEIAKDF